jgi:hypothetical protein
MRGLPGATLATINVVWLLILNTTPCGVTGMERDRGQVSRLAPAPASWFTPEPGAHPDHRHGGGIEAWLAVWARHAKISSPLARVERCGRQVISRLRAC